MSASSKTWNNNNPPSVEDEDLNGFNLENNNLITGSGQALNTSDNQQTHKAVAQYSSDGAFYSESGIADAYVVSAIAPRVAPTVLRDGLELNFVTTNASTGGAVTVNPFGIGATPVTLSNGSNPAAGDIDERTQFVYDDGNSRFEVINPKTALTPANDLSVNSMKGITTVLAGDAVHDITFSAGSRRDSTDTENLVLASPLTKQIDATFALGNNAGGLADDATASANGTLHCFIVKIGSSIDIMYDDDVNCANGVANEGVTAFRIVWSLNLDGSSEIIPYTQDPDGWCRWTVITTAIFTTSAATSKTPIGILVPNDLPVLARIRAYFEENSDRQLAIYETSVPFFTVNNSNASMVTRATNGKVVSISMLINTDTSQQISYHANNASITEFSIATDGYRHPRGQE